MLGDRTFLTDGVTVIADNDWPALVPGLPPGNGITRPRLHKILQDAVLESGADVRTGVTIETLEDTGDRVDVVFTDACLPKLRPGRRRRRSLLADPRARLRAGVQGGVHGPGLLALQPAANRGARQDLGSDRALGRRRLRAARTGPDVHADDREATGRRADPAAAGGNRGDLPRAAGTVRRAGRGAPRTGRRRRRCDLPARRERPPSSAVAPRARRPDRRRRARNDATLRSGRGAGDRGRNRADRRARAAGEPRRCARRRSWNVATTAAG